MPLLDHFQPPLAPARHWESFHVLWAGAIAERLNRRLLPEGYFAETQVHVGNRIVVDVVSLDQVEIEHTSHEANGGVAMQTWSPPTATMTMPAIFPDSFEIQVYQMSGGATLVAAIELVSPRNKDRPEARRAFASNCANHLHAGIGLVVVDVVTDRHANLHNELVRLLEQHDEFRFLQKEALYALAYHPIRRESQGDQIDIWAAQLVVGELLPTMPLPLRGGPILPLDLEATHSQARQWAIVS